jgi:protein-S-isoprenylcysteine O-methyltransferase Ste14
MADDDSRGPNVLVPPPLLFVIPFLEGLVVQHFVPIQIVNGLEPARILKLVGVAEILIALALNTWAVATFRRLRTSVIPRRRASVVAEEGPYALSRNPMYLGFAVMYLGFAFVANALWPLPFLPEAIALVYVFAIRREEQYLAREFGDSYGAYRGRVRRWI